MSFFQNLAQIFKGSAESKKTSSEPALVLQSPLTGRLVSLSEIPDEVFASKVMGDGVGIEPSEGLLCSPVDGEVVNLFRTQHAIGLLTAEGLEVLLHIGLDTVKMNGEGFKALVKTGDQVKAGQPLIEFNVDLIEQKAKSSITPVVITNPDKVESIEFSASGPIKTGQPLFKIRYKV